MVTQGDFARAKALCTSVRPLATDAEGNRSVALAQSGLANSAHWGRDYERARSLCESRLVI